MARMMKSQRPKFAKGEFKTNLVRLSTLFAGHRKLFIGVAIASFFEAVMITFATFCLAIIYNNYIIPNIIDQSNWVQFVVMCCMMLVIHIVSQVSFGIHNVWVARVSERIMYSLRREMLNKLHLLPVKYFDITPSGEIMTRMSSDIDNISQLSSQHLSSIFFYTSLIFTNTLMMFFINWFLALVTMVAVPIMIIVNLVIVRRVQPSFIKQQNSISKLNGFAEEMISGTKVISLFRMQEKTLKDFDVVNKELTDNSLFAQTASNLMMPINNFLTRVSIFILCALGLSLIIHYGFDTEIGKILSDSCIFGIHFDKAALLIVFTMFSRNFTEAFNTLVGSFSFVFYALAGAKRVFEILDAKEEKDLPEAQDLVNLKGKVEAKNLCFGYEPGKLILKNLNFEAKAGQTVAIVGPTGAGKTTITNLITKFYDLTSGQLLIDDKPIEMISRKSLRQNIAVILQDTFLFAVSVKENIRYGRLDATDEEIVAAAKEANLDQFIRQLPHGYDTILHDNGSDLSAGQRQLLTIARAFLAKPKIVILDEATSSIDTKTELVIAKAMDKLMEGKTCFVIAHRLSTIANADNILVLKDGRIVEEGKHQELLDKNGFYAQLYDAQFKKGQTI